LACTALQYGLAFCYNASSESSSLFKFRIQCLRSELLRDIVTFARKSEKKDVSVTKSKFVERTRRPGRELQHLKPLLIWLKAATLRALNI
jgi:hypothetical protein